MIDQPVCVAPKPSTATVIDYTKSGKAERSAASTPKVEKNTNVDKLHQKRISTWFELADFLREHEGEWFSPYEIHRKGGGDIRTVKNRIERLANTSYWTVDTGYKIEIAQRKKRIYCIRFVKDIENSIKFITGQMAEVKGINENIKNAQEANFELLMKHCGRMAERDSIRYHAQRFDVERLRKDIHNLKKFKLEKLHGILLELKEAREHG